jgi:hypothetical protein
MLPNCVEDIPNALSNKIFVSKLLQLIVPTINAKIRRLTGTITRC